VSQTLYCTTGNTDCKMMHNTVASSATVQMQTAVLVQYTS